MVGDLSFCELKDREVINVYDGKRLGRLVDITFTCSGKICGIIVPGDRKFFKSLTGNDNLYIPWKCICKIGEDTILVELNGDISICDDD